MYTLAMTKRNWISQRITTFRRPMSFPSLQFSKNCRRKEVTKWCIFYLKHLKLLTLEFHFWKTLGVGSNLCSTVITNFSTNRNANFLCLTFYLLIQKKNSHLSSRAINATCKNRTVNLLTNSFSIFKFKISNVRVEAPQSIRPLKILTLFTGGKLTFRVNELGWWVVCFAALSYNFSQSQANIKTTFPCIPIFNKF